MPNDDKKKLVIPEIKGMPQLKNLEEIINQKNLMYENVLWEKSKIEQDNLKLIDKITEKDKEVKNVLKEKTEIETRYLKMNEESQKQLQQKNLEIERLQNQIEKIPTIKNTDEHLMKELMQTRIKFQEVDMKNNYNVQELIQTKSKLHLYEERIQIANKQINDFNKIIENHQKEKSDVKTELEVIKTKVKHSYSAVDMSNYLNTTIESFNSQVNEVDNSVNYIINEMDVDLKAQVYRDELDNILLSSPEIGSNNEDNMSSIKFSIRAVPKL